MKKTLALLLVLLALVFLTAPIAIASAVIDPVQAPVVEIAADEPVIEEGTPVPTETDPGGAPLDLTPILQALIALLASWITLRVIPWLKARTTERQFDLLLYAVSIGVKAAENLFPAGSGAKKFEYVCQYLRRKGFSVDESEIEAMVWDQFNRLKALEKTT